MALASLTRVREVVRKEFLQLFRDPRLWRLMFLAPVLQLIVFGYALSTDLHDTATYLVDFDNSQASRELVDAFTASGYFRIVGRSRRPADLVSALDHGDARVGIQIPADFSAHLRDPTGAVVQIVYDGTDSNTATVAQGYAQRIVQNYAERIAGGVQLAVELQERAWFNPNLVSRDYNVPAVAGAIVFLMCLLLTSLAVVREREIGTLEQLMVSPLSRYELIAGKTIPFALVGLVDVLLVTAAAVFWFRVPFEGSFALLMLASLLYVLSGLGLGLLVSTSAKTQQEAFLTTFLIFMPTILLSGLLFPVNSMPKVFQWLTYINPMRHFLEIVRGIFLKGAGLSALWHQLAALLLLGVSLLGFAASRFRKRVE
jgi:ABC-2 type transport system permease protein